MCDVVGWIEIRNISVQRGFQRKYRNDPAYENKNNIRLWFKQFEETGSVQKQKSTSRSRVWNETVGLTGQADIRSPKKPMTRRSLELGVPKIPINKFSHKILTYHAYKIHIPTPGIWNPVVSILVVQHFNR